MSAPDKATLADCSDGQYLRLHATHKAIKCWRDASAIACVSNCAAFRFQAREPCCVHCMALPGRDTVIAYIEDEVVLKASEEEKHG